MASKPALLSSGQDWWWLFVLCSSDPLVPWLLQFADTAWLGTSVRVGCLHIGVSARVTDAHAKLSMLYDRQPGVPWPCTQMHADGLSQLHTVQCVMLVMNARPWDAGELGRACMHACVCVCMHACVRACVRAFVCKHAATISLSPTTQFYALTIVQVGSTI